MKHNTIVLTGGGTAGHVSPNINLSDELYKHFNHVVYIGSKNGIEKNLISTRTKYEYHEIDCVKFERKKLFKALVIPFKLSKSITQAKKILKKIKPDVIFSKGGYVALPVVIAAHKLNIPVVCHESDITMGLANKLSSKFANKVCTNFQITSNKNATKFICTGSPILLSPLTKSQAKEKLKIKTNKPILLITGGSLGAKSINEFIFKNINVLTEKYFVLHLVGKNNLNKKINNSSYKQIEFSNDMWTIFKVTDYAISRAGANTIMELLANKIPTIFIPLPKNISRGDQIENAQYLEKLNIAISINQEDLNLEKVQNKLIFLENNNKNIVSTIEKQNFNDGTNKILKVILSSIKQNNKK